MRVNGLPARTDPAAMAYLLFKLLHIVAVVLFLGNVTTGVFWVRHAARHRSRRTWPRRVPGHPQRSVFTVRRCW